MESTELRKIERYHAVICNSLFMVTGKLEYDRITEAITRLADSVHDYDGDSDELWSIGEHDYSLSELIVGAYWHYTEWHAGQWSPGYAALSSLGRVFDPGMTYPEEDNPAYVALNEFATLERS